MRTPLQAMIWELWRTSRLELLLRTAAMVALVAFLVGFCANKVTGDPEMHVITGIFVMVLTCSSISSQTWLREIDRQRTGFSLRLGFVRPVSTIMLVAVPTVYIVVTAVVCYLAPAALFQIIAGPIPMAVPAVLVGAVVVCFMAASWSPTTMIVKVIALTALAIGMVVSLLVYHTWIDHPEPILMAIGKPEYFALAWYHYIGILMVTGFAFAITVASVQRQRRGDRWVVIGFGRHRRHRKTSVRGRQPPFSRKFVAQCWYEARRFGPAVLLTSVSFAVLVLVLVTLGSIVDPPWEGAPYVWLGALAFCPFVYQIIGADGALGLRHRHGAIQISSFDATRAMSNDRLVACKLLVIAACSLIGWLCMGLAAGSHAILAGDWPVWVGVGQNVSAFVGEVPSYWWIAGISNAVLLYISSSSIVLAFGMWLPTHRKLFGGLSILLYAHVCLAVWDHQHDGALRGLWTAYGYVLAAAILAVSVRALRKALSVGFLSKPLFAGACGLWVIYVLSTVVLFTKLASVTVIPTAGIVLGGATLLVPLAATAIAPLALASHRHA